jgi:outer membrane protein OmpA-like peptidoglycan-associated protein
MTPQARTREQNHRTSEDDAARTPGRVRGRGLNHPNRTADRSDSAPDVHPILRLQRTLGNRAVQRFVTERPRPTVQPKLEVGRPDDASEREADRVAEQVVRTPDPPTATPSAARLVPVGRVQRMCPRCQRRARQGKPLDCPDCEAELRRTETTRESPAIDDDVGRRIRSLHGGGRPLSHSERSFFEPRFGADFSGVRIHTGGRATEAARSIHAKAFTMGQDVVFQSHAYQPNTTTGRRLLAHELTHVVQQRGRSDASLIQRQQTDAGFESGTGVDDGISNGTLTQVAGVMGQTFAARNCRGLYGCDIDFEFEKAYTGVYPYAAAGRDVRGVYVKIVSSFDAGICGSCGTVRLIQTLRNITRGSSGMETADPGTATRRERSGWGDSSAPSRGWRVDTLTSATNPFYSSTWASNAGSSTTPAVLWDAPGNWASTTNAGREFQTCSVCDEGGTRKVLACVTWGYYTDTAGTVSFRPSTPSASCGPTQELQDAVARWEGISGNQPADIDFTPERASDQRGQRSVLWFEFDSQTLRQDSEVDSRVHLAHALRRIRQHLLAVGPDAHIVVHGYSSTDGNPGYNMELSRRRAEAVRAELVAAGIPADRISIVAEGEDDTFPGEWNRRAEIEHTTVAAPTP